MNDNRREPTYDYTHFSVQHAPVWVYLGISEPAKQYCGDVYWVRLKELLDKEKELETLRALILQGGVPSQTQQIEQIEEVAEKPKVRQYLGEE